MNDHTGIERRSNSFRATVRAGRSKPPKRKTFPLDTPTHVMQEWRQDTHAALRMTRKQRALQGSFAADAKRYLLAVKSLTTYKDRAREIAVWVKEFDGWQREDITAADIRTIRERWAGQDRTQKGHGHKTLKAAPLAPGTINKRLRALSNVWTVLDGRRAPNPVRDVPELPEPDALPRAVSYDLIEQILAAVRSEAQGSRLRVLAYTGLTYAQLGRLAAADVDLEHATVLVKRRAKGKGAKPRLLPLLPQAVEAFRQFHQAKLWGAFDGRAVRKSFQAAVRRLRKGDPALPHLRPYDLRHSFATAAYKATRSLETVQALLQHQSTVTSLRYALSAVDDVLKAQTAGLGSHLGTTSPVEGQFSADISVQAKAGKSGKRAMKTRDSGR